MLGNFYAHFILLSRVFGGEHHWDGLMLKDVSYSVPVCLSVKPCYNVQTQQMKIIIDYDKKKFKVFRLWEEYNKRRICLKKSSRPLCHDNALDNVIVKTIQS